MDYEYQAIDNDGALVRGIVKASNPQKVMRILLELDLHPLEIQPLTETTVEISRLNQLKRQLSPKKPVYQKPVKKKPSLYQRTKMYITGKDWTYTLFVLLMIGIISLAVYSA